MFQFIVWIWIVFNFGSEASTIDHNWNGNSDIEAYQIEVETWLRSVDSYLNTFNSLAAYLTWTSSIRSSEKISQQSTDLGEVRNKWKNRVCDSKIQMDWLTPEQSRKLYLFCRGPRYNDGLTGPYLGIMGSMATVYTSEICLSENDVKHFQLLSQPGQNTSWYSKLATCLSGEPDLERLMKRNDLNPEQKKWIWKTWHDFVGPPLKKLYPISVNIQNSAARNNGYNDMGEVWREELEIPDLENEVMKLYKEIQPLYVLLHAVVRHKLLMQFGTQHVDPKGPLPVHLLGNMWGQDWSTLMNLFIQKNDSLDLDKHLKLKHWKIKDMVWQAEDMYASLGLPRMTRKFWNFSIFEEGENTTLCHGTAANLFNKDDYRMLMCSKVDMEGFYVIHHEMGHIQYYMAYQNQPAIFQDGANSAMHECVGDAIMNGVVTPQHLYRLGLLNDDELLDPNVAEFLLFQQALSKIPEIPFSLLIDKYRWDIFRGRITPNDYNRLYWELNKNIRGIVPPETRTEAYFDAGAKFHIPDNTPYIRYFLSSILHMQLFKGLCENTFYGASEEDGGTEEPELLVPLHRCDIYGSKKSGIKLKKMMEKGSSIDWSAAMEIVTGKDYITTKPLLEYYRPVYKWLEKYISMYNVHVGW